MQFGESNIECSYILNLLFNFYTPTIRVLGSKATIYENEHYIKNGLINTYRKPTQEEINKFNYDKDTFYNFIDCGIDPGRKYLGLTRNCISESNNYSTDLHEALGNYLRFIRDYYKVDLMPLYNCFSNRFIDSFSLPFTYERRKGSVIKQGTKLFAFPVRFGNTYSIFCKNNADAFLQLAFFNGKIPLEINAVDKKTQEDYWIYFPEYQLPISQWQENTITIPSIEEKPWVPFQLNGSDDPESEDIIKTKKLLCLNNQINLYLFVEIPEKNADNIIIIENNSTKVVNNTLIQEHLQKPFSDKLMGYLLNYYISPLNNIKENIEKYQSILSSKQFYVRDEMGRIIESKDTPMTLKNYTKGIFDYPTREFIYDLYRFANIPDFTGYIDKDVEKLIIEDSKRKYNGLQ